MDPCVFFSQSVNPAVIFTVRISFANFTAARPNVEFVGFGGTKMAAAGCNLTADMTELAIMGFARVVPHLKKFWDLLKQAESMLP